MIDGWDNERYELRDCSFEEFAHLGDIKEPGKRVVDKGLEVIDGHTKPNLMDSLPYFGDVAIRMIEDRVHVP